MKNIFFFFFGFSELQTINVAQQKQMLHFHRANYQTEKAKNKLDFSINDHVKCVLHEFVKKKNQTLFFNFLNMQFMKKLFKWDGYANF